MSLTSKSTMLAKIVRKAKRKIRAQHERASNTACWEPWKTETMANAHVTSAAAGRDILFVITTKPIMEAVLKAVTSLAIAGAFACVNVSGDPQCMIAVSAQDFALFVGTVVLLMYNRHKNDQKASAILSTDVHGRH
jgi:hypothetical protein